MATEKGTVTKVFPEFALVKSTRSSSCESCSSKDACHLMGGEGNQVEIEALNSVNAQEGDRVLLSLKTASLFKLSFLLYILPIIFLFAGAIIGEKIAALFSYDPSSASAFVGFLFLLCSLGVVVVTGRRLEKKREYRPQIIRILQPGKRRP